MTNPILRTRAFVTVLLLLAGCASNRPKAPADPPPLPPPAGAPNVLFIAVDDLRPALGCYGDAAALSPRIDALASRGTVFNKAYCQQAVCAPSRNTVLTGRRPDTARIYDLPTNFRTTLPNVVTLPQHFKRNGYHAESMGKIYHVTNGNHDDRPSWSVPSWNPGRAEGDPPPPKPQPATRPASRPSPESAAQAQAARAASKQARGSPYGIRDVADADLPDGQIADRAIERLGALKAGGQPFFLAVGFHKPHLPFIAPRKYWDLHDPSKLPPGAPPKLPAGAPAYAGNNSGELRQYAGVPDRGPMPADLARDLVHGYYACVSYMDAQVGRVLDELDRLGLRDNTVVVLWGDHGFQLNDHGLFCKHTNYEQAVRSPLIVSAPGDVARGARSDALVELVDLYPTLAELAGLPAPAGVEGTSLVPLLRDANTPWKSAAFSQWPKAIPGVGSDGMGYSVRTARYRLTEWTVPDTTYRALELYDYETDPHETRNLAKDADQAKVVEEMVLLLRKGWRGAVPAR